MYCIVLTGPTGDHDSLPARGPGQLCTSVQPDSRKAHRHNWNSTSDFLCPEAQVNRHHTYQEHHTKDTRDEDDEEDEWNKECVKRMT